MTHLRGDLNIGQVVHGNVSADRLVLNIGGQLTTVTELDDGDLRRVRKGVFAALRKRRRFASLPNVLGTGLLLGLWSQVPTVLRETPSLAGMPPGVAGASMMIATSIAVWLLMRTNFADLTCPQPPYQ